ncbi:MAG: DUF4270 family protein [Alistipes sp.]|nr:DUF4270 family protein [Alistipes sp.]
MRNYSNRFCRTISLLSVVAATIIFGGCSMTADSTLGSNMMPEDQIMVMRHLKFQGNNIIRLNTETGKNEVIDASLEGKNFLETRLYRTDSLLSSNTGNGYMGVRRSSVLGQRTAGFASTIIYMNAIDEESGFGYKPIFDTMKLILSIKDYGGDTLVPIRYQVFELTKPLAENVLKYDEKRDKDSIAYINCDLSGVYDESKPIFEFTFPKEELNEGPSTMVVSMENTPYSWDYARRLMLIPDNYAESGSDWDGYGRTDVEAYTDDKKWSEKFYGLYIKPDPKSVPTNLEGAMYSLDLTASGIMLQGRSRNPKDPTMIKDTVGMYYYFCDDESKYNASVVKVEHDYSQGMYGSPSELNAVVMDASKSREERTTVSTCYVEGLGGPSTEIYLTDDFLSELVALETTESGEYSRLGINQCLFTIYVAGADYDWNVTQSRAEELTPLLDKSLTRLGSYLNYNTLSPVIDYDYVYENNYNTEVIYNGYLDRSRGCYTLNLTAHIQKLFNSIRQEDGTYDVTKAEDALRTIYIGTEATAPYVFTESVLQGMPTDERGASVAAPIQIDLTYTLVK